MENGAEKVDGLPLEEETNVTNGILGVEVEEKGVAASDKLNEEAEEEVFEEAIEDQEQLEQQGTDEGAEFSFKTVASTDSVVFDESGDTGMEVEAFEDASSVPAQVQNAQNTEEVAVVHGAAEAQGISGGESIDKIDEGGTGEDVGGNELNGGKESLIGDHESTKVLVREDADSSKEVELSDDLLPKDDGKSELKVVKDDGKSELKVVELGSEETGCESIGKVDEEGSVEDVGENELNEGKEGLIGDHESTKVLVCEDANSSKEVELSDELLPKDDGKPELKVVELVSEETGGESIDKIDEGGAVEDVGGNELNGGKESLIGDHESTKVLVREDADSSKEVELSDELPPKDDGEPELQVVGLGSDETGYESVDEIDEGGAVEDVGGNELNGGKESLIDDHENTKVLVHDDADSSKEGELSDELLPKNDGETELKVVELDSDETGVSVEASAEAKEDNKDEGVGDLEEKDAAVLDNVNGEQIVSTSIPDNETGTHASNGVLNNSSIAVDSQHSEDTHKLKATPVLHTTVEDGKATSPDTVRASDLDKIENETSKDVHILAVNSRAEDSNVSELLPAAEVANRVSTEIPVNKESQKQTESVEEKKTENVEKKKAENRLEEKKTENGLEEKKAESVQEEKKAESVQEENKIENSQEEKKSSQVRREKETQPVPKLASSIGKGTNPAPQASHPAGLGRAAPLLEPAPRAVQHPRVNGSQSQMQSQQIDDSSSSDAEEFDETREKLQMIRVKFLRLAHRLGQTPHNVVVAQVLYRLGLAEQLRGRNGGRVGAFSFDRASAMAEHLENGGQEPLDFCCTIMVLGKTGVGKSATINSIFDEVKFNTDAFELGTKKVQDVEGTVQGIKVRVIDTPGLLPSWSDQHQNEKILHSVKRFIRKNPPDIVLYLDRLDMQSRDFGDMPLLRTITEIFGPSIWFNAIVVLTHAASAPPDGPNGTASTYDMFVTQRSHVVQQAIRQAAGDMRLMNPVSLVENHSACRTNRAGQRVLPNGQVWKPHLLLLSFASKILAEANMLLKLQDSPPGKPFAPRSRAPPLPFLLSSLLQSRPHVKLPEEQFGDEDGLDDDLDDSSDSEEESEYDSLPPFKSLSRAQVSKLTKTHKKAYFEELEYREKLFMKKQLRDEKRRRRFLKKMAAAAKDLPPEYNENGEEEVGGAASVPVPMPDLALPASFDSDNPTHRYRSLEASNQWLVRPVLDSHGWDHDVGYEGINVERLFVVKDRIPISFSGQVTKDKKDANLQMELASSLKHGEGKGTSLGFDLQTVGKDLAYTLRSETRFCNFRRNKATAGLSFTLLGDALSAGLKVEDKLIVNKRFQMVMSGGAMTGRGDVAYGGSLEAQVRDKDYPLGRSLSTLGLSVMDWHGDLAVGCNIQSQVPIGRTTNLIGRANLNNRGAGQVSVRVNSSEQLQIALIGLIPLLRKLWDYPQQMPYGQGQ